MPDLFKAYATELVIPMPGSVSVPSKSNKTVWYISACPFFLESGFLTEPGFLFGILLFSQIKIPKNPAASESTKSITHKYNPYTQSENR